MARITVEDALEKVSTRYELIILAAKRARQLATGGRRATLGWEDDKPTVMALREIEAGTVTVENVNDLKVDIADLEQEFSEELSAEDFPKRYFPSLLLANRLKNRDTSFIFLNNYGLDKRIIKKTF